VPYIGTGDIAVLRKITSGVPPERPEGRIPPNNKQADLLWSLLTHCWLLEPEERPTASLVRDVVGVSTLLVSIHLTGFADEGNYSGRVGTTSGLLKHDVGKRRPVDLDQLLEISARKSTELLSAAFFCQTCA
jgi:hypothetical protein